MSSAVYRGPKKWMLIAPALVVLAAMTIYPVINVLIVSFQDWALLRTAKPNGWNSFENFIRAFSDPGFWNSIVVITIYTLISVTLSIVVGVLLALQLYKGGFIRSFLKACLIFPYAISPALKGYTWRFMLNPHYGIIDRIIGIFIPSLSETVLLGTKSGAMFWLAYTEIWGWAPFLALVFIGALDMIHPDVFAAAKIDGASPVQLLFKVKLPLIAPVVIMVTLLKTVFSVKQFDAVVTLTAGGPGQATETINFYIWKQGFKFFEMGYASAMSLILIIFMILFAAVYLKVAMPKENNV